MEPCPLEVWAEEWQVVWQAVWQVVSLLLERWEGQEALDSQLHKAEEVVSPMARCPKAQNPQLEVACLALLPLGLEQELQQPSPLLSSTTRTSQRLGDPFLTTNLQRLELGVVEALFSTKRTGELSVEE
jgi:hypothetical protein